jgi:hypothetical protein
MVVEARLVELKSNEKAVRTVKIVPTKEHGSLGLIIYNAQL